MFSFSKEKQMTSMLLQNKRTNAKVHDKTEPNKAPFLFTGTLDYSKDFQSFKKDFESSLRTYPTAPYFIIDKILLLKNKRQIEVNEENMSSIAISEISGEEKLQLVIYVRSTTDDQAALKFQALESKKSRLGIFSMKSSQTITSSVSTNDINSTDIPFNKSSETNPQSTPKSSGLSGLNFAAGFAGIKSVAAAAVSVGSQSKSNSQDNFNARQRSNSAQLTSMIRNTQSSSASSSQTGILKSVFRLGSNSKDHNNNSSNKFPEKSQTESHLEDIREEGDNKLSTSPLHKHNPNANHHRRSASQPISTHISHPVAENDIIEMGKETGTGGVTSPLKKSPQKSMGLNKPASRTTGLMTTNKRVVSSPITANKSTKRVDENHTDMTSAVNTSSNGEGRLVEEIGAMTVEDPLVGVPQVSTSTAGMTVVTEGKRQSLNKRGEERKGTKSDAVTSSLRMTGTSEKTVTASKTVASSASSGCESSATALEPETVVPPAAATTIRKDDWHLSAFDTEPAEESEDKDNVMKGVDVNDSNSYRFSLSVQYIEFSKTNANESPVTETATRAPETTNPPMTKEVASSSPNTDPMVSKEVKTNSKDPKLASSVEGTTSTAHHIEGIAEMGKEDSGKVSSTSTEKEGKIASGVTTTSDAENVTATVTSLSANDPPISASSPVAPPVTTPVGKSVHTKTNPVVYTLPSRTPEKKKSPVPVAKATVDVAERWKNALKSNQGSSPGQDEKKNVPGRLQLKSGNQANPANEATGAAKAISSENPFSFAVIKDRKNDDSARFAAKQDEKPDEIVTHNTTLSTVTASTIKAEDANAVRTPTKVCTVDESSATVGSKEIQASQGPVGALGVVDKSIVRDDRIGVTSVRDLKAKFMNKQNAAPAPMTNKPVTGKTPNKIASSVVNKTPFGGSTGGAVSSGSTNTVPSSPASKANMSTGNDAPSTPAGQKTPVSSAHGRSSARGCPTPPSHVSTAKLTHTSESLKTVVAVKPNPEESTDRDLLKSNRKASTTSSSVTVAPAAVVTAAAEDDEDEDSRSLTPEKKRAPRRPASANAGRKRSKTVTATPKRPTRIPVVRTPSTRSSSHRARDSMSHETDDDKYLTSPDQSESIDTESAEVTPVKVKELTRPKSALKSGRSKKSTPAGRRKPTTTVSSRSQSTLFSPTESSIIHGDSQHSVKTHAEEVESWSRQLRQQDKLSKSAKKNKKDKSKSGRRTSMHSDDMMRAMRMETEALDGSGRPSMGSMMRQWEFLRANFVNSDEELEWLMESKMPGAYKYAKKKGDQAEDKYFKSLFDIDVLDAKLKLLKGADAALVTVIKDIISIGTKYMNASSDGTVGLSVEADKAIKTALSDAQSTLSELIDLDLKNMFSKEFDRELDDIAYEDNIVEVFQRARHVQTFSIPEEIRKINGRKVIVTKTSEENLKEMEKWTGRMKETKDYARVLREEEEAWFEKEKDANEEALRIMRRFIPANIAELSVSELAALGRRGLWPQELLTEVKTNKLLHWLVTHPDDIVFASFLTGEHRQYFENLEGLDIIELRALSLCLPSKFELDGDGRKMEWRSRIMARVKQLVAQYNRETVKGGWSVEKNCRATVTLPPLKAEQLRRSIYYYRTKDQIIQRIKQLDDRATLIAKKEGWLEKAEIAYKDAKAEYDTILNESRDADFKRQYGADKIAMAKEIAKREMTECDRKRKGLLNDISNLKKTFSQFTVGKDQLLTSIEETQLFIYDLHEGDFDWAASSQLILVKGIFDPCPEINRKERSAAKFVTAEQEAEQRKQEIASLKTRKDATVEESSGDATSASDGPINCDGVGAQGEALAVNIEADEVKTAMPTAVANQETSVTVSETSGYRPSYLRGNPSMLASLNSVILKTKIPSRISSVTVAEPTPTEDIGALPKPPLGGVPLGLHSRRGSEMVSAKSSVSVLTLDSVPAVTSEVTKKTNSKLLKQISGIHSPPKRHSPPRNTIGGPLSSLALGGGGADPRSLMMELKMRNRGNNSNSNSGGNDDVSSENNSHVSNVFSPQHHHQSMSGGGPPKMNFLMELKMKSNASRDEPAPAEAPLTSSDNLKVNLEGVFASSSQGLGGVGRTAPPPMGNFLQELKLKKRMVE